MGNPIKRGATQRPQFYDPFTGWAQTWAHVYRPPPAALRHILGLTPDRISIRRHAPNLTSLANLHILAGRLPRFYAYPGRGLLPIDPHTGAQYLPAQPTTPDPPRLDPASGAYEGMRRYTDQLLIDGRRYNRAQVVAATAFGYHPLTPVMAWYIHDPQTHGYGIDNIYTPTQAGYYQLEANPGPPQPHESESDHNPPQPKRFIYHPDPLPDWPDPLPTIYDWMP